MKAKVQKEDDSKFEEKAREDNFSVSETDLESGRGASNQETETTRSHP